MSTKIVWCLNPDGTPGETWNPILGCSRVSAGCENCYAERLAGTRLVHLPQYADLTRQTEHGPRWTGQVNFLPEKLHEPLKRRKPTGYFVCDMGDLFHEHVTDEQIAAVSAVTVACPRHWFYVLTKRAKRMREWFKAHRSWPLPNVWLGVTVENQDAAEKRIPLLLETPAALRFLSIEPMLSTIDLSAFIGDSYVGLSWAIIGAESGPRARPCDLAWVRSVIGQCKEACIPVFVKQVRINGRLSHDPVEWPEDLRVREMPTRTP